MRSYKLFIRFYSPMVYYHRLTLDAVISYCLAREDNMKKQFCNYMIPQALPPNNNVLNTLHLIIEHKGGFCGVPVSSFLQPIGETAEYLDSWKKRFDSKHVHIADFHKARRRVDTASGKYRSYNNPLPAKAVNAGWFAFIGDGPEVVRLIENNIVGMGKKVSEGFGWIDGIELHDSELTWRDILAMRPVPLHLAENHGITGRHQIHGWRPPYWLKHNICECVVPQ